MQVQLTYPHPEDGFDDKREMPAVPRVGDQIYIGSDGEGDEYEVTTVVWYPDEPGLDAYVVVRP